MRKTMLILLCLCAAIGVKAGDGSSCYNAIAVGKDYKAEITQPQTVWYTAWTYDLPLAVYFIPQQPDDPAPEVMMDFGCTPGTYADPIICMLFCKGGSVSMPMPHKPALQEGTLEDGTFVYYLSMGKSYRDLLMKMGVDYNVQVFVKVTYKRPGTMSMAPDDMFSNCMDGAKFIHFGDTINVKAEDKTRHVVVPYVQWQTDSIRYIWQGTKSCMVTVANDCKADPTDYYSDNILSRNEIQPGDTLKVPSARLKHLVQFEDNEAGMFFAKFYSAEPGVMKIEEIPMDPPRNGAKLLYYDKSVTLLANDTNALFAIPKSWEEGTKFTVPTNHIFRMYIDENPDFTLDKARYSFQFKRADDGHIYTLEAAEMKDIVKKATDYMYVRFECTARTSFLATEWSPSECMAKWPVLEKGKTISATPQTGSAQYYRLYYNDWEGGDISLLWGQATWSGQVTIGDSCEFNVAAPNADSNPHAIKYQNVKKGSTPTVITADEIATWKERVDPDGYLYIRGKSGSTSSQNLKVSSSAPEEKDPTYPSATIAVECIEGTSNLSIRVSENQTLIIKDESGTTVQTLDAVAGTPETVTLPAGKYILSGTTETIAIQVP